VTVEGDESSGFEGELSEKDVGVVAGILTVAVVGELFAVVSLSDVVVVESVDVVV